MQLEGYILSQPPIHEDAITVAYAALRQSDRRPVLIKCLNQKSPGLIGLNRLQNEYAITQTLDCPGITRSLALLTDRQELALVLETNGDASLEDYSVERLHPSSSDFLRFFFRLRFS
jgi:hypothetical protein